MFSRFLHPLLALFACLLLIAAPACATGQARVGEVCVESSEERGQGEEAREAEASPLARRARAELPLPTAHLMGELHGDAPSSHGVTRRAPRPTPCWLRPLRC